MYEMRCPRFPPHAMLDRRLPLGCESLFMKRLWIGIDTGGTFTDIVAADVASGEYRFHKLPTTTDDPAKAILQGIAETVVRFEATHGEVEFLVLGTTLATNAVLEGKTARTGMLTTRGFRDVLELARQR